MNRLLLAITAVILSATSCMREFSEKQPESDKSSIQVSIEQLAATKTYLDDTQVKWTSGDRLLLFDGTSSGSIYTVSEASAGSVSAHFLYEGTVGESGGYRLDHSIAYYPMDENVGCLASGSGSYKLTGVTLPARQIYQEDSFASGAFLRGTHALITWLIILCSRNSLCTHHVSIMHCSRGSSWNDHVATIYWSRD